MSEMIPIERVEGKIFLIRGQKVMLDRDLAELYGVKTFVLNQAIKRNLERFPEDFMFSLNRQEILNISQIVISSSIKHARNVNAFTENGIAMLSSILRSKRAIQVNIQIMRTFTRLRMLLATHKELIDKFKELEGRVDQHDVAITALVTEIRRIIEIEEKPRKQIGFVAGGK